MLILDLTCAVLGEVGPDVYIGVWILADTGCDPMDDIDEPREREKYTIPTPIATTANAGRILADGTEVSDCSS